MGEGKPPTARERGLPGLLGTDLGPQLSLMLGGCTDALGRSLGQGPQSMLWSGPGPGWAGKWPAHSVGIFAHQRLADLSVQGLLSLTPAATTSCWDF